jgi:ATP-dependent DNA helicase RecQ
VGRAGRAVDESYGILLHGNEEDDILDYFLNEAFPSEDEANAIVQYLDTVEEARLGDIKQNLNLKDGRISKALKHLEIDGFIGKNNYKYSRTVKPWQYDEHRIEKIKNTRITERQRMKDYIISDDCLMEFITTELDDPKSTECGICINCSDWEFPESVSKELIFEALEFLNQDYQLIEPRKRWPAGIFDSTIIPREQHIEQGRAMCLLEDAGWGEHVKQCFNDDKPVSDDFLDAAVHLINEKWNPDPFPEIIVDFDSQNFRYVVSNFSRRLAEKLNINYWDSSEPEDMFIQLQEPYKPRMSNMKNSHQKVVNGLDKWKIMLQHHAIDGVSHQRDSYFMNNINDDIASQTGRMSESDLHEVNFGINSGGAYNTILLVDDFVDSRWTFTIIGGMLCKIGFTVYPFSLGMVKR